MNETDEITVSYLVLCDQVIVDAASGKQSLIGIYSALMADHLPLMANIAVAVCLRVQSDRPREITLKLTGPDGSIILSTPPLGFDWGSIRPGLNATGFASLQFGVNLLAIPFPAVGVYTATLYSDGTLIATYPIAVMQHNQRHAG